MQALNYNILESCLQNMATKYMQKFGWLLMFEWTF